MGSCMLPFFLNTAEYGKRESTHGVLLHATFNSGRCTQSPIKGAEFFLGGNTPRDHHYLGIANPAKFETPIFCGSIHQLCTFQKNCTKFAVLGMHHIQSVQHVAPNPRPSMCALRSSAIVETLWPISNSDYLKGYSSCSA